MFNTHVQSVSRALLISGVFTSLLACEGASASSKGTDAVPGSKDQGDLIDVATSAGNFTTLLTAIQVAGLEQTIRDADALTVFAPTDEAFQALPDGALDGLLADPEALRNVLLYHVVEGAVPSSVAVTLTEASMLNGTKTAIRFDGMNLFVNESKVVAADVGASNGVIHVVDGVLLPPAPAKMMSPANSKVTGAVSDAKDPSDLIDVATSAGNFTTLLAAIRAAGLEQTIRDAEALTVFAPTDEAFQALPDGALDGLLADPEALRNVLLYHVVEGAVPSSVAVTLTEASMLNGAKTAIRFDGTDLFVNESKVIAADVQASNGVIHVIDQVLLPRSLPDVIDTAEAAGSFSILLTAVRAAGLEATLREATDITLFAPTDEAFAKIPAETLQALLNDREALTNVLLYHVVGARVSSSVARTLTEAEMLNGSTVRVSVCGDDLKINDSKVIAADVDSRNAVIHVVDTVLIP